MEPGIYLTILVFAVAALHLTNKAVTFVIRYNAASSIKAHKAKKAPTHRDDWYMFFHQSDLTGNLKHKTTNKQGNKKINTGKHQRSDSRPVLRSHLT